MKLDERITLKEAKSIRNNYIKKNKGKTQQVFFEYEKLMNYLTDIVKDHRLQDLPNVGIKIYLGEYNDTYPDNKKNRITVMLVPTIKNGTVNQDVLDITEKADGTPIDNVLEADLDSTQLDENFLLDNVLEAFNHGSLCPPFPEGAQICAGSLLNE